MDGAFFLKREQRERERKRCYTCAVQCKCNAGPICNLIFSIHHIFKEHKMQQVTLSNIILYLTLFIGKVSAYNEGDPGSIPELGRSPGEVNGNPLQYSCLGNPIDGGTWRLFLNGIGIDRNLSQLQEIVEDRGIWCATVHKVIFFCLNSFI